MVVASHLSGPAVRPRAAYVRMFGVITVIAVLVMSSRGIMEIGLGKAIAYIGQFAMWSFLMVCCLLSRSTRTRRIAPIALFFLMAFIISCIASAIITVEVMGTIYGYVYAAVFLYIALVMAFYIVFDVPLMEGRGLLTAYSVAGGVLVFFGIAQQLQLIVLPGDAFFSVVRPSSLTGSYLHYPLLVAICAFVMLEAYRCFKERRYLVYAIIMMFAIAGSMSRSGAMIVFFGLGLSFILYFIDQKTRVQQYLGIVGASALPILVIAFVIFSQQSLYVERIVSALDVNAAGNSGRIGSWAQAFQIFLDGPIIFGDHAGLVTNITRNLTNAETVIAESGFLQHLANVGLLGCVTFYSLFYFIFREIHREHIWLRALIVACALQSFVFQSIEVFPFIAMLGLLPIISRYLYNMDVEKQKGGHPMSIGAASSQMGSPVEGG